MRAKKSFGQHFLKSEKAIAAIIEAAEITPGDSVLEIGPGTGVLTTALLETGANLTVVEADKDLLPHLEETFPELHIVSGDVMTFSNKELVPKGPYKLVANLPYNVGSLILRKFLSEDPGPERLVVMLQKEVGERLLARPGDMSLISVAAQIYADVSRVITVPPGAFNPPPKVDSIVVRLDRNVKCNDPEAVLKMAKAGFANRRKQLHKNIAAAKIADSDEVKDILEQLGFPPTARAQELPIQAWIDLENKLSRK